MVKRKVFTTKSGSGLLFLCIYVRRRKPTYSHK